MKQVSDKFKSISKKIKQQNLKVLIKETNEEIAVKELKYKFEGELFKTIMKEITFSVKNAQELEGKTIQVKYGLLVDNEYEYVDIGEYVVKDIEEDKKKEEISITCYDNMLKFMTTFNQDNLEIIYPCTMLELIQKICQVCGVELYSTDFYNSKLSVTEDFFTVQQLNYRDVLVKIAQSTLSTIFIKENKLYLCNSDNTVQTLDASYITSMTIEEKFGPINALVLGRGDVEDNIESIDQESIDTHGRCEIRFDENEFLDDKRENVIDDMFNQMKGIEYYAFESSDLGVIWLEPCDWIELQDRDGNSYKVIYLKGNITINTGITGKMSADIPETIKTEYKITTEEQKKYLKVERLAKKNEGIIRDVVEQTESITKTKNTLEGTTIKIDDSAEEPILELELDGKSTQATRSGKNLYNYKDTALVTYSTVDDEGWITVTYDNTEGANPVFANYFTNNLKLKSSTQYSIIIEVKNKSGSGSLFYTTTYSTNEGQFSSTKYLSFNALKSINIMKEASKSNPDDMKYGLRSYIKFDAGQSGSITFRISVLEDTTVTEDDFVYEPYGASPSPEFPSEIKSVGDDGTVTIEQRGKNLFNKETAIIDYTINFNNGSLTAVEGITSSDFIEVKPNTQYYCNFVTYSSSSSGMAFYDKNKTFISGSKLINSIVTPDNAKYFRFSFRNEKYSSGTFITDINTVQLEEDTEATDYEPYFSKDYVIPLSEPLRSLPNGTKDTIEEDGIHRRVRHLSLAVSDMNGSENYPGWSNLSQLKEDLGSNYNTPVFPVSLRCNILKDNTYLGLNTKASGSLFLNKSAFNLTQTEWKEQYPNLVVEIDYELSEEVVEPFTDEQLEVLQSIETNLYTQYFTSDANMRITYVRNNGLADMYETKDSATRKYTETEQKIAELNIDVGGISATVGEVTTKLENDYMTTDQIEAETSTIKEDVDIIKKQQASVELTSKGLQVQIDSINNNGVKVVKNTLVDIDEEGIKVSKGSEFNSLLDDTGVYLKSYDKEIASYTKDGATMYNLTVQNEAIIGNLRALSVEVDGEKRTHIHWIGG